MRFETVSPLDFSKISILATSFSGGGAERVAVNLANDFINAGYDVDFLVVRNQGPNKALLDERVKLIDLNAARTITALLPLRKYLRHHRDRCYLSVIRDTNILLGLAGWGIGSLNTVFREANPLNNLPKSAALQIIYKILMRFTYANSSAVVANSLDTKRSLLHSSIIEEEKVLVIPNPVFSDDYWHSIQKPSIPPSEYDNSCKTILSVGRLVRQKDYPTLIRAFERIARTRRNLQLVIIGDGEEKENLKMLSRNLKVEDRVSILSFRENIKNYYDHADVFALSSIYEGFGNVLVEALASGLKVVSTECPGGPREILLGGRLGTLCRVGDDEQIASALNDALDSDCSVTDQRKAMEKYRASNVSSRYLEAFAQGQRSKLK